MIILQGKLLNVMQMPKGTRKDGTEYGGNYRVQIQHEQIMKNGQKVIELINLAVDDEKAYTDKVGSIISVPVSPWANGGVNYMALANHYPSVAKAHVQPRSPAVENANGAVN